VHRQLARSAAWAPAGSTRLADRYRLNNDRRDSASAGSVAARGKNDAARLEQAKLVYHGVVRTPLCALAQRVRFFATSNAT